MGMEYRDKLKSLLNQEVVVYVDRPLGYKHGDIIYPLNYGYIKEIIAPDGEYQDAYILGVDAKIDSFKGKVIAIIHRKDDIEDKLVVSPYDRSYSKEEIESLTHFQERFFKSTVITG